MTKINFSHTANSIDDCFWLSAVEWKRSTSITANNINRSYQFNIQIKPSESEGSESSEGSTEGKECSKQNSYVRSDNNIQDNY